MQNCVALQHSVGQNGYSSSSARVVTPSAAQGRVAVKSKVSTAMKKRLAVRSIGDYIVLLNILPAAQAHRQPSQNYRIVV